MLKDVLLKLAVNEGFNPTGIEGLSIYKLSQPFPQITTVSPPSLCFIGQGGKVMYLGDNEISYNEGQFLLTSLRLPVASELRFASPEKPYLGLVIQTDSNIISELLLQIGENDLWRDEESNKDLIQAGEITKEIELALTELLKILSNPMDMKILGEAKLKEIYYRILMTPIGYMLRNSAIQHSKAHQIAPVVQYIEKNFNQQITINDLTRIAGMSSTTLHEAFKKTTSLTPIQFIKKVRLHNAYTLITSGRNATDSAYASGYSNAAQFSREFKREYGISPSKVNKVS